MTRSRGLMRVQPRDSARGKRLLEAGIQGGWPVGMLRVPRGNTANRRDPAIGCVGAISEPCAHEAIEGGGKRLFLRRAG